MEEKYFKLLWWPTLITLIFEIAALFTNNGEALIVAADIFLIFYLLIKIQPKKYQTACWIGGTVIFFLALCVALAKLLIYFKFYYIFNLITEPIIYAAGAALLSYVIFLIINKSTTMKGGDNK